MRMYLRWMLALLSFCAVQAQEVSPSLFNGLNWRLIGPFRGGRAVAVTGIPGGGSTFFMGAVDGGIWKTTDAGTVWAPIFDGQPVASIGALEVAPSDPQVLYAGTGESDIRSDLASGDGVYKSTDGGATWKNIGLQDTRQISRIAIDPRDPNTVFVAALGHAYAGNPERGVFKSRDGGQTWKKVLYKGPTVGAADLAIAPDAPDVLLAAMWEAHRPPWSTYAPLTGPGSGLYRSIDGGETWQQLSGNGLPAGHLGRIGVAIARGTHAKRMYAAIEADPKSAGIYRSDDGGNSWARVNSDARVTSRAWYFNCITVDPNDPDVLYIPNVAFYKLSDGGKTLSIVRGAPGGDDYHQVWIDPANSAHMVLGTDQGTTVTLNGGKTWSTWYNQPTAQFYHVITDNAFPYHVYGAQQDSGTAATASQTDHGEIDSRDWFSVGGSESGYIAPDPRNPDVFYISGTFGELVRSDRRTMQNQNIAPWPMPPTLATPMPERKYRDPWTPVLVFSPVQPNALYLGTQYVMKTLDGGLHWQKISPDLTGVKPDVHLSGPQPANPVQAMECGYGVVYTIAPSPLHAGEIWVGSDTGLIHLTRNAGASWSDVTPQGVDAWSKITQIEVSHFTPGEAYAAVDRHRLDDMRPYLFRTRDYGKTWTPIVNGIGEHAFLNSIREDPKRKGLLFAGTEFGVYVSFDDGEHWLSLQRNLPVTSIRDLAIHDNDLIAATHGRAFWVLDDIAPLRQMGDKVVNAEMWLYRPSRALRMTSANFTGTPLPPEEPQAQNPPRGAYIDYYLRKDANAEVALDILDAQGKTVRHYSSRQKPPAAPHDAPIAPRWFPKPQELSEHAGMHRFLWDLRYGRTGETTPGDDDEEEQRWRGPLVLPGRYRVRLTIGGEQLTQPLDVAMDPRTHVSSAVLAIQFRWAQRAFEDMIHARRAAAELHGFQTQIDKERTQMKPGQQSLSDALSAAGNQSGTLLTGTKQGSEDGMQALSRQLTVVLNSLESADRLPPAQLIELYRQAAAMLKTRLAAWDEMKRSVLPGLNRQLQDAGMTPIQIAEIEEEAEESLAR